MTLNFSVIAPSFSQASINGFTVTRETYNSKPLYTLSIGPENLPYVLTAIDRGELRSDCLHLKPSGRYGHYSTDDIDPLEKFVMTVVTFPVFMIHNHDHNHVVVWHRCKRYRDPDSKVLDFWYTLAPEVEELSFRLEHLGIGGIGDIGSPGPYGDRKDLWIEAVKNELRKLIDSGHIVQDRKPEPVKDWVEKATAFSQGDCYGY